jgi:4-phospho-D-threonate 3-dehydrogenase / 4-phospho-D-erythronate 3-dehydrogenase
VTGRKRIGVTMGDPAGIGPEVMLKGLGTMAGRGDLDRFTVIAYGTRSLIADAARSLGIPLDVVGVEAQATWPQLRLVETGQATAPIAIGAVSAEAGRLAFAAVERAIRDAVAGRIDAIVTGPISKEAINVAGYAYAGHTEILADLAESPGTCMMLIHDKLRVSHVSTHVALAKVPELVTPARLTRVIKLTVAALKGFGITQPRIGVAALNPHAGEGGLFGREDNEIVAPTIATLRSEGMDVTGPFAGDTIFVRALAGTFDAVIAMFHDQGHIPIKLLGFKVDASTGQWTALTGVNVTLGLPFVRTSVDHGTAFDIAGKSIASPESLIEAVEVALEMVK